jgi:hypothetical protein
MTYVDNIAAVVDAIGMRSVGVVWGLGMTQWESEEQRDSFLAQITGKVDDV